MSGNDASVLDVLQAAANGFTGPIPMQRAHDLVAELIAADSALDDLLKLPAQANPVIGFQRKIASAWARRAAALAACKG